MSSNLPQCPNNRRGTCERSEPVIVNETDTDYTFGCRCCHTLYVVTKPAGWRRGKMAQDLRFGRRSRTVYDRERIISCGLGERMS